MNPWVTTFLDFSQEFVYKAKRIQNSWNKDSKAEQDHGKYRCIPV